MFIRTKLLNYIQKLVEIYLFLADLKQMTEMGRVFEQSSDKSSELRFSSKMDHRHWFGLVQTTIHFALQTMTDPAVEIS